MKGCWWDFPDGYGIVWAKSQIIAGIHDDASFLHAVCVSKRFSGSDPDCCHQHFLLFFLADDENPPGMPAENMQRLLGLYQEGWFEDWWRRLAKMTDSFCSSSNLLAWGLTVEVTALSEIILIQLNDGRKTQNPQKSPETWGATSGHFQMFWMLPAHRTESLLRTPWPRPACTDPAAPRWSSGTAASCPVCRRWTPRFERLNDRSSLELKHLLKRRASLTQVWRKRVGPDQNRTSFIGKNIFWTHESWNLNDNRRQKGGPIHFRRNVI